MDGKLKSSLEWPKSQEIVLACIEEKHCCLRVSFNQVGRCKSARPQLLCYSIKCSEVKTTMKIIITTIKLA